MPYRTLAGSVSLDVSMEDIELMKDKKYVDIKSDLVVRERILTWCDVFFIAVTEAVH